MDQEEWDAIPQEVFDEFEKVCRAVQHEVLENKYFDYPSAVGDATDLAEHLWQAAVQWADNEAEAAWDAANERAQSG